MIKRSNQNKLTLYRRHAGSCVVKDSTKLDACECPIWTHGKVAGKFIRQSLDTRAIATALQRKENLLNGCTPDGDPPNGGLHVVGSSETKGNETLEYAATEFLKASDQLSTSSRILYKRATESFISWSAKHGLTYLREIETSHVAQYFREVGRNWKRSTAFGRLVHLRIWMNFCKRQRWITYVPTEDRTLNHSCYSGVGKKKKASSGRVPFTPAEITKILAAVEQMPEADRAKAKALILLLLYTGMRISDATFFERAFLTERNTVDYYVIKTRSRIALPPELQEPALRALQALPASRVYFFQPDAADDYIGARTRLRDGEEFSQLMPNYERRVLECTTIVRSVLKLAGLPGACHRFRDTFAINLLTSGVDIFSVSQMLGHSDVRVTQGHYLKLIPGYRERMSQATRALAYQFPIAV